MKLKNWEELPDNMKNNNVKKFYDILYEKRFHLFSKRVFDVLAAILLLIFLSPAFILISISIKMDSKGPVIFHQVRVTQYGQQFRIYKFRTMINNAEKMGTQVTTNNDSRITKIGKTLRKTRLDEIPQLFNIILGEMSFVGTRPEVVKYVDKYTNEMMATLLLPAGVTSEASIQYKDEEQLLANADDADVLYVDKILPEKMKHNLKSIEEHSFINEMKTIFKTVIAITKV